METSENAGCRNSEDQREDGLEDQLVSIERSKYRRVVAFNFTIKTQPIAKGANQLK
jgi:hypothetical protein